MKLGNFFVGNVFTISQSPHGTAQNGKAIDAVPASGTRVIAPCDMEIYYRKNDLGHQSYSYARGDGWKMVFVHCIIEKLGHVKKGTDIGYLHTGGPVHLHVAIEVNGVWDIVLNYMKRTIQLALAPGFASQHWKSWSTWKDLNLADNSMAQWSIDRGIRDKAAAQMDVYLNTYRKDVKDAGVDPVLWWVQSGSAEVPEHVKRLADEIARLVSVESAQTAEIKQLNASIGGLTTDRNKYKAQIEEIQPKIDSLTTELNTSKIELEGTKKQLEKANHDLLVLTNEIENTQPLLDGLRNDNADLTAKNQTLIARLEKTEELYQKCLKNNRDIDLKELLTKIIRVVRVILAKAKK